MNPKLRLACYIVALVLLLIEAWRHRQTYGFLLALGLALWLLPSVVDAWDAV